MLMLSLRLIIKNAVEGFHLATHSEAYVLPHDQGCTRRTQGYMSVSVDSGPCCGCPCNKSPTI